MKTQSKHNQFAIATVKANTSELNKIHTTNLSNKTWKWSKSLYQQTNCSRL